MSWTRFRYTFSRLRAMFFTVPKPDGPFFVVESTEEELKAVLGAAYFAPNWEFSYKYRGEDLNLARIEWHIDDDVPPTGQRKGRVWWQTHVRGWEVGKYTWQLTAHWELEPTENDKEHIDGLGFDVWEGMWNLGDVLDDARIYITEDPR